MMKGFSSSKIQSVAFVRTWSMQSLMYYVSIVTIFMNLNVFSLHGISSQKSTWEFVCESTIKTPHGFLKILQ